MYHVVELGRQNDKSEHQVQKNRLMIDKNIDFKKIFKFYI